VQVGLVGYFYEHHRRQRLCSGVMPLQISRDRYRPADRIYFSRGGHAEIPEPEGLWPVQQRQQAGRLERVVDVCAIAGTAIIHTVAAADHYQNAS